MEKELLKYDVESIRWGYITEEHGKVITFLTLGEKGPIIRQSRFTLSCFVTGSLLFKDATA